MANELTNIRVFPNPSNGKEFSISYPGIPDDFLVVEIFSIDGRKIKESKAERTDNRYLIKDTDLSQGLYFLKIKINSNQVHSEKIMVIH